MNGQTVFIYLRSVLATLYGEQESARRVAADAGLDVRTIAFSAKAIDSWHAILSEAIQQGRLDPLIERVHQGEYGANPALRRACDDYRRLVDQGGQLAPTQLSDERSASLRTAYLNHLYDQVSNLALAGVDPKAASDAKAQLRLEAVYTALLTQVTEDLEAAGADRRRSGSLLGDERKQRRLSAVEQLNRHRLLVLLGAPGSGKSSFVNFVVLCLAGEALAGDRANLALLTAPLPADEKERAAEQKSQPWEHGALLPVRVTLRDFAAQGLPPVGEKATAGHLWQFICAALPDMLAGYVAPLRQELLERGGLLLLDGLDEVPEAEQRRMQIKQAIEDFAALFPRCRVLVTSRTYAYQEQAWHLRNFVAAELAPFTPGQIRQFVDRWYAQIGEVRGLQREDAQGRAELLKHAILQNERLRVLVERPLLLALTASLHAWRGGSLPERREELYADAVDLLLDWWESQRVVRNLQGKVVVIQPSLAEYLSVDRDKVRALLNRLAYEAHASQLDLHSTADISESTLIAGLMEISPKRDLRPGLLVDYLSQRAGLLLPHGVKVYTFPHRTFQEYLAACHLTEDEYPEKLAALARQEPNRWREVALLAGAKAARGASFALWSLVDELCYREPQEPTYDVADQWGAHLAGQTLVEAGNLAHLSPRNQERVVRVQRCLVHLLTAKEAEQPVLPALERAQAGRVLAQLGDPRAEVITIEQMHFCYVPGGPFFMGEGKEEHRVELPTGFWISRYPVTNAQYQIFVAAGGYVEAAYWPEAIKAGFWRNGQFKGRYDNDFRGGPYPFRSPFDLPNHPVVGVSWYEALAFTRWLTAHLRGRDLFTSSQCIRLSSEAEWEKAARGGIETLATPISAPLTYLATPHPLLLVQNPLPRRVYPWGESADANLANYNATEVGTTNAVGCFADGTSSYGVEEMSGNVWEWTSSLYQDYPYQADDGREDPESGDGRSLRGGSFVNSGYNVRCAARGVNYPNYRDVDLGFRVVSPGF